MGVEFMIFFLYGQNVALLKANEVISSDTAIPLWLGGLGVLLVLFIIENIRLPLSFRLPKSGEGS
jgi:hypothetical protein